jgi:hypothetical protein
MSLDQWPESSLDHPGQVKVFASSPKQLRKWPGVDDVAESGQADNHAAHSRLLAFSNRMAVSLSSQKQLEPSAH